MPNNEEKLLKEIEDLKKEIQKLKERKKYGLVWDEKQEQVVLDCQTKIPVLKELKNNAILIDINEPFNILIEGDNYHSLSVLNYTHKGKIDVIYIDPPYNTGSSIWRYNNNYVDGEDAFRHSKWLSFMEKRLKLAKNLLKESGVIIATIDDYEIHSLGLLMDEIFNEKNRMSILVIESNPRGRTSNAFFATSHEYYLFYAKNASKVKFENIPLTEEQAEVFKHEDEISKYRLLPLRKSGAASRRKDRPKQFYPIYINPGTCQLSLDKTSQKDIKIEPIDGSGEERVWKLGVINCQKFIETGDVIAKKNNDDFFTLYQKDRIKIGRKPKTVWVSPSYDASAHGTNLISEILSKRNTFDYPKSLYAVIDSLNTLIRSNKKAIVLDFFAGSGTTGHAILEINKQDDGKRKFILCTDNENNICEHVCYPRVKNSIVGYKNLKGRTIHGLGGNLKYFKTDFVDVERVNNISDERKIRLTYQAGEMIALREDTLDEKEKNNWWQIFTDGKRYAAIYFKEDKSKLQNLVGRLSKLNNKVALYIFSWGKNEYKNEFVEYRNIRVEDIPEPIIEVYREINKL